ncbi:hypothetical protein MMC13_000563 [Lambiella insularis]|nr:hypothetical protein [Lambiella insularis]
MSPSTPSSHSSLTRFRPAILALAALAAGYTIYYVHSNYHSIKPPSSHSLARRNAVHRRQHRRRNRQWSSEDNTRLIGGVEALELYQSHDLQDFGQHTVSLNNSSVTIPLRRGFILPLEQIGPQFELNDEEAIVVRDRWHEELLSAVFESAFPHHATLIDENGIQPYVDGFGALGFSCTGTIVAVNRFNSWQNGGPTPESLEQAREMVAGSIAALPLQVDGAQQGFRIPSLNVNDNRTTLAEVASAPDTVAGDDDDQSWRGGDENEETKKKGQSLLNLLYHIAEDQARRDGYVHRGVSCNSCNTQPIRGIRYRCANCVDFDLCEQCEASQIHPRTHVFYKVRIPAPFTGSPRHVQPVWYPGRPVGLPPTLPREVSKRFQKATNLEGAEIEALWDQFKCLAATDWPEDPDELGIAIDRITFDKCFTTTTGTRRPPPNLIYDRMFAFYDTNSDGLIGFGEFLTGLFNLKSRNHREKMKKVFEGYDLDRNGFVSRKDMLRMFRAFYALTKELTRELIASMEEDAIGEGAQRDIVESSLPISSAFPGPIPLGEASRIGQGKSEDNNGDYVPDRAGITDDLEGDEGDHHEAVGNAFERAVFGDARISTTWTEPLDSIARRAAAYNNLSEIYPGSHPGDSSASDDWAAIHLQQGDSTRRDAIDDSSAGIEESPHFQSDMFPEDYITPQDVQSALHSSVALESITDPTSQWKVRLAARARLTMEMCKSRHSIRQKSIQERWKRRDFYIDEENGVPAPEVPEQMVVSSFRSDADHVDPIKKRTKAIKYIRDSLSLRSFKVSIKDEMNQRQWGTGDEAETMALVDLLINMAGLSYEPKVMVSDLEHLGHYPDAENFVQWLLVHISNTEQEIRSRPSITTSGHATKPQRRSRSSSKVRFEDDLTDNELETRSNTSMSSRSIPLGERWGGFEVPEPEKNLGQEYLYQVTQESLNELLDPIFKQREDLAMEVFNTSEIRSELRPHITQWLTPGKRRLVESQIKGWQKDWRGSEAANTYAYRRYTVGEELLNHITLQRKRGTPAYNMNIEDLWAAGMQSTEEGNQPALDRAIEQFMGESNDPPAFQKSENGKNTRTNSVPASENGSNELAGSPTTAEAIADSRDTAEAVERAATEYPEPATELHQSVAIFDKADPSIEQAILQTPLDDLLHQAGYSIVETSSPSPDRIDPTLPQHRPSTIPASPPPSASASATAALPFDPSQPPSAANPVPHYTSYLAHLPLHEPPRLPELWLVDMADQDLQDKIKFLAMMDFIEKEDAERGGPGQISLEEFEEIMAGPRGERLAFVGAWIHMATFWGSGI